MTLTVGELVAYAQLDKSDFQRGTRAITSDLRSLQASTSSSMQSMESTVSRASSDIARELGDAFDPAQALTDIDRLIAGFKAELDAVDGIAGRAGRRAGDAFVDEARDALNTLRYGEFDVEIDADIAQALAALGVLEQAAEDSGERAGERFVRGADGRLRDARGRFVAEGKTLFDGLAEGAERSGGLIGRAMESGLGVIGRAGPANVALAAAAIQALPVVAGVAAGGIVAAIGGGLAAVGFKAAATSDQVRHAWSETADEIKRELADVAKPFEGSAIRAADVAERAFDRLKPSLKRIFKDLVPDVDAFINAVGDGVGSLGPTLERLGDAAGNVLRELGDRMPEIIDNISDMLDTFTEIANEDPQMLADLVEDATELLAVGAEVLSWADELKATLGMLNPKNPGDYLLEQILGATPEQMLEDMEKLPLQLARFQAEAAAGALAIQGVGGAGDEAAGGVRNFSDALEELFDPAAAALGAEIRLKEALKDAAEAAKEGKLTNLDRLKTVRDVTSALADAATAEHERTGKTIEASAAFARQLPTLADLAGKNDAARDAVAGLGNSLGVTIKRTDDGKIAFDKLGQAVVTLPSGKTVKVDADTAKALAGLADTKKKTDEVKDKKVKVDADTKQAVSEVKKVTSGLNSLKGDAHKAGQDLGSGLTAGIRSMIGDAIAAAKNLASAALKGAKDFLGIKSPSTVMAEVGRWTVKGLIVGLTSEEGQAVDTVKQLVGKIKDAFSSQPDIADGLVKFVQVGNDSLAALAKQRDELVAKLAAAKEMAKQVAGDAAEWAAITGLNAEDFTGAGDMAAELKSKASAINNFANNITELARRGLNKKTIQQIIDAGVEKGATFAEMLVGSDGSEIKALNKAQAAVDKASKKLGKASADAMFDTGKQAGEGYLKGLQESLKKLDAEMEKIVKALVRAIKKELKIKSPSQVMADIGVQTIAGWIVGIESMTGQAMASVQKVVGATLTKGSIPLDPSAAGLNPLRGGLRDAGDVSQHGYTPPKPGAGAAGGTVVQVDMTGAVIREEADVPKLGREFGFQLAVQA
ncbi:hypothetical protein ACFXJ8_11865 [Nonomuraea sp. NPDC059194]|uniref:hypothetical protein n=1 Tax=Nonomuraea sp. NPDC059194 TaxID=3346764 RepID=UPI00368ABEBB